MGQILSANLPLDWNHGIPSPSPLNPDDGPFWPAQWRGGIIFRVACCDLRSGPSFWLMVVMAYVPLDPLILRQAQQGDTGARDHLLEQVYRRLFPYCLRLTRGDSGQAEEIAQETGLRLLRSLPDLRDSERVLSWVLRVATNLWRDRLRGRQDYPLSREVEDPGSEAAAERKEMLRDVSRGLNGLPAVYRAALTLRFLKGLDYEAMSEVLGVPQATLRMHIARGIRLLRKYMDGEVQP